MKKATFIDLFAGCGGLSLGLIEAGFQGLFAIEKNEDAFETLTHNLNKNDNTSFAWPSWLPCVPMTTEDLLNSYKANLSSLQGSVDIIAGGPPCQGFSFAGLRNPDDPRNRLTEEYIEIVSLVQPKVLLLENVKGFQAAFTKGDKTTKQPYADFVTERLENLPVAYKVYRKIIKSSLFGVPQPRPRFVLIAIRDDIATKLQYAELDNETFYKKMLESAIKFKQKHKFPLDFTPLHDAIGDLEVKNKAFKNCVDSKGFKQISYKEPKKPSTYLQFLRRNCEHGFEPNSLRIPNHREKTIEKFEYILEKNPKGVTVTKEIREALKIQKQCLTVLSKDTLASTMTTLPDDCLHYSEPRVLTVREMARIQSFPDWFEFKGKYTTGGPRRKEECPRYTQVGNAVPPLMAQIIGAFIENTIVRSSYE